MNEPIPSLPRLIVMQPLYTEPEMLMTGFLTAHRLAAAQAVEMGIDVPEPFRSELLEKFKPAVRAELSSQGWCIADGVRLYDLAAVDQESSGFAGIIYFVGVDSGRQQVLHTLLELAAASPIVVVPRDEAQHQAVAGMHSATVAALIVREPCALQPSVSQIQLSDWFDERYGILSSGHFDRSGDRVLLGEGQPKICRYCSKSAAEVRFSDVSHAFPEAIGNKKLIDALECDTCNKHFGAGIDDHFGKWSMPARTVARIQGKKNKVPSYKSADRSFRIDHIDAELKFQMHKDDPRVTIDLQGKRLRFEMERQPYVPMAVYKAFVKMATAVTPTQETSGFVQLRNWLLQPDHSSGSLPYSPLMVVAQVIPGPIPNDRLTYMLLQRKAGRTDCPNQQFILWYGNHVFQVIYPGQPQAGSHAPLRFDLQPFPHPWDTDDHKSKYGSSKIELVDLSSPDVRRGETCPMTVAFDQANEIDG